MATDTVVTEDKGLILNGWERSGGCHENCGACCEYLMLPLSPLIRYDPAYKDWERWVRLHGIDVTDSDKAHGKAHVPLPCGYLTEDKKCAVHGTEDQPRMCAEGPRLPSEIVGLEDICTYKWRRVNG